MTAADHQHGSAHGLEHFQGVSGLLCGATMLVGRGSLSRLVAGLAGVGPGDRVVDVGCGPGGAAREAARRGATVTGVDPAPVMPPAGPLPVSQRVRAQHRVPGGDGRGAAGG